MAAATQQRFLQPKLLMQLGRLELRARTIVEGMMSGLHRSPFRGLSIEFAEYRRYQPGDDPSRIDWKVYARNDRTYIRQYEDETNLEATIVLDASASMGFGTAAMSKWQYGATLAACLAFLLQRQSDAIGLVVLDETVRVEMPAEATRGHLMEMIHRMESSAPARRTRLARALHHVAARLKRRGMVLVVSDLLDDPDEVIAGLRHLAFGGNDVTVFQTLDPAERGLTFEGPMLFVDPESGAQVPVMADEVRERYCKAVESFVHTYASELGRSGIVHVPVDTGQPLDATLMAFLAHNGRSH